MPQQIHTPRGNIILTPGGKAQLSWNPNFKGSRNDKFSRSQKFVDSEVLRRCSPRVPIKTGMMDKSGKLGTVIGSGEVRYIAPYSATQYYNTSESRPYDPNRGAKWFERMKAAEGKDIRKGAAKIAGK